MEEVKLWAIDGAQVKDLKPTSQTETEKLLEDTLVRRPDLLLEDLTLIGRQTPTEGGPLDLLGVDGDGRLVVFELKRGTLSRDAVAQVIDYASDLDRMELDELANHISQRSGNQGIEKIEDFEDWYTSDSDFDSLESLKPLRVFLVGLGVDSTTERMVRFLSENSSMDISLLTFHGFDLEGRTILAKQVEVRGDVEPDNEPEKGPRRRRSKTELWASLDKRVEEYGIQNLFNSVKDVFRENWPRSDENPGGRGLNFRLPPLGKGRRRRYARIDPINVDKVLVVFYPRSVVLCKDGFREPIEKIPYQTYPRNREALGDENPEILFILTQDDWDIHKDRITVLVQSIYKAWQNQGSGR